MEKVIDVNPTGLFAGGQRAIQHFLERDMPGVIVNLSSVHEIIPWPHFADYAASKAGVGMLTKTLALEYADRGIRVNAVAPGTMNMPINAKKFVDPAALESTVKLVPMGRIGDPEDVSTAVCHRRRPLRRRRHDALPRLPTRRRVEQAPQKRSSWLPVRAKPTTPSTISYMINQSLFRPLTWSSRFPCRLPLKA